MILITLKVYSNLKTYNKNVWPIVGDITGIFKISHNDFMTENTFESKVPQSVASCNTDSLNCEIHQISDNKYCMWKMDV